MTGQKSGLVRSGSHKFGGAGVGPLLAPGEIAVRHHPEQCQGSRPLRKKQVIPSASPAPQDPSAIGPSIDMSRKGRITSTKMSTPNPREEQRDGAE